MKMIHSFDVKVLLLIQSWRRNFLNKPFKILTFTGTSKMWFAYAIVLNLLHSIGFEILPQQELFLRAMLATLLAWVSSWLLKKVFLRTRPGLAIAGYEQIHNIPTCGSFPSGHTATTFALFFALAMYQHPLTWIVATWAILVSFSRMYLGVHFFSDILGGIALGAFSAFLINSL